MLTVDSLSLHLKDVEQLQFTAISVGLYQILSHSIPFWWMLYNVDQCAEPNNTPSPIKTNCWEVILHHPLLGVYSIIKLEFSSNDPLLSLFKVPQSLAVSVLLLLPQQVDSLEAVAEIEQAEKVRAALSEYFSFGPSKG